ncbi:MAG: hypothetical protein KatS3mg110_0827 [Pirellulaceae bacterium]|nr:MAG: hypothetical protein KatS3mg110_0827 [Pirellulaceae bacterium]
MPGTYPSGVGRAAMRVVCSHCRKAFSAPDRWKGQHVECPSCGQVTRAEDSPGASSAKPSRGLAENAAPSTTHRDRSTGGSKPRAAVPVPDEDDELRLLPEEDSKRPKVWVGDLEVEDSGSSRPAALAVRFGCRFTFEAPVRSTRGSGACFERYNGGSERLSQLWCATAAGWHVLHRMRLPHGA